LGFARSETDETSASDENDRDLPPKNFESPGLLHHNSTNPTVLNCNLIAGIPEFLTQTLELDDGYLRNS
jgi:hypothetical protein